LVLQFEDPIFHGLGLGDDSRPGGPNSADTGRIMCSCVYCLPHVENRWYYKASKQV